MLARGTKFSVFDEPEAGIDLWSFSRLTQTFEAMHKKSESTIIIISHQERIIKLGDEVILVAGGKITHRGSADEVIPHIGDLGGECTVREAAV